MVFCCLFLNEKRYKIKKRGCVKTPNIKILNSLCVHLWMRNEFFHFSVNLTFKSLVGNKYCVYRHK